MERYKQKKIVCAGHICLDITPVFEQSVSPCNSATELLMPGHLIPVGPPDIHIGGSVGNTGLALKQFGADVLLIGKIGKDVLGRLVVEQLKSYQVKSDMIEKENTETSYSVILSLQGIDRIILHHSGANDTFTFSDINYKALEGAVLFHFGYPPIMKEMYLNRGKECIRLFKTVKELGIATSLDMAIPGESSEAGKENWNQILQDIIPYVDIFAPSVEELAFLIDRPRYYEWLKRSGGKEVTEVLSIDEDVKPLADRLMGWGAKIVLIKCGARGMYLRTNIKEKLVLIGGGLINSLKNWENCEAFEKSYKPDKVVSATGAGDTSIAAFLCSILEGCEWEQALHFAAAAGASSVEAYDALSGLRSFEEMKRKIEEGWEKI